jgi:hypothetical protein
MRDFEFAGELALTGDLRPIRGAPAMTRDRGSRPPFAADIVSL